jgi:exportin-5
VPEKLALIVSEMAKRDWPQRWPRLMDDLTALAAQGPSQLELVSLLTETSV